MIAKPANNGITKLSLIGVGRYSTIMPIAAPIRAINGLTNIRAPRKPKIRKAKDPSSVFEPLKGRAFFESVPPNNEAVLSPKAKIAIAALLAGIGKIIKVRSMPKPKYIGAKAI